VLDVERLTIDLPTASGLRRVVEDVSFKIAAAASLGLVGESGSGKTMTALAIMGLLPERAAVEGTIRFEGQNLVALAEDARRRLRGDRIAMVFQEPMTALNPLHHVGSQVAEPLLVHGRANRRDAKARALELIESVRLAAPRRAARAYPHELSGGERQRAMIAMAIACSPKLLIADEPTTALDVTVQANILDLLGALRLESEMALMLVSHDLAVVARTCATVAVMYGGMLMEVAPVGVIAHKPAHPYTRALLAARPRQGAKRGERLPALPLAAPPTPSDEPGCVFAPRCAFAIERCRAHRPPMKTLSDGHVARCVRLDEPGFPP